MTDLAFYSMSYTHIDESTPENDKYFLMTSDVNSDAEETFHHDSLFMVKDDGFFVFGGLWNF